MSAGRPRWYRRWWLWLLLVLLALPALLAAILLDPASIERTLKQLARENYGLELRIEGQVALTVFPRPRLALTQVRLSDGASRGLARMERLEVDLPWRSLWTSPPPLGRIWVSDATIMQGPGLDDWLAQFTTGPPAPALHWPVLEDGISARRIRFLASTTAAAQKPDSADLLIAEEPTIVEIEALDLDPLYPGAQARIDLVVLAEGYRLGLELGGQAEEAGGALRLAQTRFDLTFGPSGDQDDAVVAQGEGELSLLPAGGGRGTLKLTVSDPRWLGEQAGLALRAPLSVQIDLSGEFDHLTDAALTLNSAELDLSGTWPLGPDSPSRQAQLQGDYRGTDGVQVKGLVIERLPAEPSGE